MFAVTAGAARTSTFEKIQESFLREDFTAVETMAAESLSKQPEGPEAEEVRYLRALSLLKLGRMKEGRSELERLERISGSPDMKKRVSASLAGFSLPMMPPSAPHLTSVQALRQGGIEESVIPAPARSFSKKKHLKKSGHPTKIVP